jgi:hypothetical protein
MIPVLSTITGLLLFLALILAAGASVLGFAGYRARFRADAVLAAFAAGMGALGAIVYMLLLCGLYYQPVAVLLCFGAVFLPAWGIVSGRWTFLKGEVPGFLAGLPERPLDRSVALGCLALIFVGLIDAASSPMTLWDAVVSWDKWASEWAGRTHMHKRLLGYYPQLMPMVSSLAYKVTGADVSGFSITHFALHAFQPVTAGIVVLAVLRLASLFEVAAWPALLLLGGSSVVRLHMTAGSADMLSLALYMAGAVVLFSAIDGQSRCDRHAPIFYGAVFFGVFFAKTNNLTFIALAGVAYAVVRWRGGLGCWPAGLSRGIALAAGLFATFLIHQYLHIGMDRRVANPLELNFDPAMIGQILTATTDSRVNADTLSGRLGMRALRASEAHEFPGDIGRWMLLPLFGYAMIAIRSGRFWPLLAAAILQTLIWGKMAAYDTRNLFAAIPLFGLCAAFGARTVSERFASRLFIRGLLAMALIPIFGWMGGRISHEVIRQATVVISELGARGKAIADGPAAIVNRFFPQEAKAYDFMTASRQFRSAKHLMIGSRMYRWFPNGGYVQSYWSGESLTPGDGYVPMPGDRLPLYDRWTMVYDDSVYSAHLLDVAPEVRRPGALLLTGDSPPRVTVDSGSGPWTIESTGAAGYVVFNLPVRDLKKGDALTWRVLVDAGTFDPATVSSAYMTYDDGILDKSLTRALVDTRRTADGVVAFSGILTFSGKPMSTVVHRDGILAGVALRQPGAHLRIREFRTSLHR